MDHHAYLLLGGGKEIESYLSGEFERLELKRVGNPDVFEKSFNVFGVDDAREVGDRAVEKAFGELKLFIISAEKFTTEAQNALLKTLEDPVPNTHFFICAKEAGVLLPTLLSRLHKINLGREGEIGTEVEKFLKKTLKQRLDFAKKFNDEREERGAGALANFLDSLLLKLKEQKEPLDVMKKVLTLRTFARDSGASSKIILEHLALVL